MILSHDQAGDGPTVLLLHSGVCDRRMWDAQRDDLIAAGYRVVRADFRGHGETPADFTRPRRPFEDVRDLLDHLGVERAVLVGSSFGGRVALETAARYPERVTALALLCPDVPGLEPGPALRAFGAKEDELLESGDVDGAVALNVDQWLGPEASDEVRTRVAEMQRHAFEVQLAAWALAQAAAAEEAGAAAPEPAEGAEGAEQSEEPAEPALDLSRIEAPCLVVGGAHDVAEFRTAAAGLPGVLPRARHVELAWAGHLPSLERPAETAELLLGFLAEHRG
ncbi:alpha/beta fold hydrolase [Streptomyces sp. NPDC093225]|uniref:alpha/beta fold hydrolase n=1 Tax=Streptomyces sp. NPDC093225 TaxID=3366034 RepID=UPI00381CCA3E